MTTTPFAAYTERKRVEYGARFNACNLQPEFVPFFNSGQRVRVRLWDGTTLTGTIGVTTGWHPCFLLVRTARSFGSRFTLGTNDHVIAVKHNRLYEPKKAQTLRADLL